MDDVILIKSSSYAKCLLNHNELQRELFDIWFTGSVIPLIEFRIS